MAEPFLGEIRLFPINFAPAGWAPCNGQVLQITQNQALFTVIGKMYGGDGIKTFALPNLQGRAPIHPGTGITLGGVGGEASHKLVVNEIPAHTHEAAAGSDATERSPVDNSWGTPSNRTPYSSTTNVTMHAAALSSSGGNQAHPNMQPYLTLNFCIATTGIYPPKN